MINLDLEVYPGGLIVAPSRFERDNPLLDENGKPVPGGKYKERHGMFCVNTHDTVIGIYHAEGLENSKAHDLWAAILCQRFQRVVNGEVECYYKHYFYGDAWLYGKLRYLHLVCDYYIDKLKKTLLSIYNQIRHIDHGVYNAEYVVQLCNDIIIQYKYSTDWVLLVFNLFYYAMLSDEHKWQADDYDGHTDTMERILGGALKCHGGLETLDRLDRDVEDIARQYDKATNGGLGRRHWEPIFEGYGIYRNLDKKRCIDIQLTRLIQESRRIAIVSYETLHHINV